MMRLKDLMLVKSVFHRIDLPVSSYCKYLIREMKLKSYDGLQRLIRKVMVVVI